MNDLIVHELYHDVIGQQLLLDLEEDFALVLFDAEYDVDVTDVVEQNDDDGDDDDDEVKCNEYKLMIHDDDEVASIDCEPLNE